MFLVVCLVLKFNGLWHPLLEFPLRCEHPGLPANNSGVKVMVAGFAKCGTRTIGHALNEIGVLTYHSEDFLLYAYREFIENMPRINRTYEGYNRGHFVAPLWTDPRARLELARVLSTCRVDSIAFDGMERLMPPVWSTSPDVKVIVLDWRNYADWKKSARKFIKKLIAMMFFLQISDASNFVLPWGALLRVMDPLVGRPIETALRSGSPPPTEVSGPMFYMYHQMMTFHNQIKTWFPFPGTSGMPQHDADIYRRFFDEVREKVAAERRLHVDPRRSTYEDLCEFMEIRPCPRQGRLRQARNTWVFERDFPIASNIVLFERLFLHWVN